MITMPNQTISAIIDIKFNRPEIAEKFSGAMCHSAKGSHHIPIVQFFFNIVQKGVGIKPMFKNFVANILLF